MNGVEVGDEALGPRTSPPAGPAVLLNGLRGALEQALTIADSRLERLSMASTSVCFENIDAPSDSVTILLDRQPPTVTDGREPAEIQIALNADQIQRFATGLLELQADLLDGAAAFSGPIRKYLAVHSVLRSMLVQIQQQAGRLPVQTDNFR
jgi:hypothetical protein